MLENGYVTIQRKIVKWEWYKNPNTFKLFVHLILTANYEDEKFEGNVIKRGQRVASYRTLSEESGLTVKATRTALNHLKGTQEVAQVIHPKYSVFTLNNYEQYQIGAGIWAGKGQAKGKQGASKGQQCNKANKANKEKEEEKEFSPAALGDEGNGGQVEIDVKKSRRF